MKKLRKENFDKLFEQHEPRSNDNVMEIMQEIYARMPWNQSIQLSNGKSFFLKKFIEPRFNPENETCEFGFDAKFTDESGHIEFNVTKSGWEFCINNTIDE